MVVRFGFGIFTGQAPSDGSPARELRTMVDLAPVIEESGFDSVWVSEHHGAHDGYLPSVLPLLAALGARTSRISLGTAVLLAPLHHPLRLAEDAAVVDLLSGGRLILGLGAGWRAEEFRAFGADLGSRGDVLESLVPALRMAWTGERFSCTGGPIELDRVQVRPAPERDIPIQLGANAPRALLRAGRLADGFIASSPEPETLVDRLALVDQGSQLAGRDRVRNVALMLDTWLGEVDEEARAAYWRARSVYDIWRAGRDVPDVPYAPMPRPATAAPPFAGPPQRLAEQIAEFASAAGDRDVTLICRLHYPGVPLERSRDRVEEFGAEVIPRVRRLLGYRRAT